MISRQRKSHNRFRNFQEIPDCGPEGYMAKLRRITWPGHFLGGKCLGLDFQSHGDMF